jgi:hypothetical protein
MVTDELLRRAIFDPAVRKQRVWSRQAGLLIDVEDLRAALEELLAPGAVGPRAVDQAIGRHGGHRVDYGIAQVIRAGLRRATRTGRPRAKRQR